MASKKRGGLSKREYAAAQKAKAAPKVAARPSAKKTSGIGPVASGQQYSDMLGASQGKFVGPYAPSFYDAAEKANPNKATFSTSREQASKAKNRKSGGGSSSPLVPKVLGISTARADDGIDYNQAELTPQTKASGLGRALQIASDPFGIRKKIRGATGMADFGQRPDFGITEMLFGEGKDLRQDTGLANWTAPQGDTRIAVGPEDSRYLNELGSIRDTDPTVDANQYIGQRKEESSRMQDFANTGSMNLSAYDAPYSTPATTKVASRNNENNNPSFDNDPTIAEEMNVGAQIPTYEQSQNDLYGGGPGPVDQASPRVTNQVRGSGLFGTGKGVGNPAGEDPYIKELRKAYSSNGGEKWLRKQFEELIAALDPTYAQYEKEGTDALNANLNTQNVQLASVMNANNTGDSEQRAQLMAGQQRDTQTAIGNLLAKLALNKSQDVSSYRSQMAEKMGQYKDKQQTNQQRLISEIQNYRNQQQERADKMVTGNGSKSYGTALDNIMATQGVDINTARKIYDRQNGLVAERNPIPSGEFRQDPQDGQLKQLYIVDGQLGFMD